MSEALERAFGEAWPAPAKLNLLLRIVGRRDDGYHLLQTVFQFVDLADRIWFYPRSDHEIHLRNPQDGIAESDDLTVRAACLLQQQASERSGVDIRIEKNIPIGGGLGGGSSDAATVLTVLNRIWRLNLSRAELMELGLQLGADVPIFIHGQAAWAEGVGEILKPIEPRECWYVVLVPACQVSTAKIFDSDELTRNNKPVTIDSFHTGFNCNDCLSVVFRLYPLVEDAFLALSRFGEVRLTGTGSCVFLPCANPDVASEVAAQLEARHRVLVVKGCNRSPLHQKMQGFFDGAH